MSLSFWWDFSFDKYAVSFSLSFTIIFHLNFILSNLKMSRLTWFLGLFAWNICFQTFTSKYVYPCCSVVLLRFKRSMDFFFLYPVFWSLPFFLGGGWRSLMLKIIDEWCLLIFHYFIFEMWFSFSSLFLLVYDISSLCFLGFS